MDRISNLPGNAIDCILERLPLVDRVRTSVLSSSWRYIWTELPSLELDKRLFDCIGETLEQPSIPSVYIMIVNSILFQVKANVREFSLYVPEECDQLAHTALSHLIQFVLSNGVRKLSVLGYFGLPFHLPSSVFSSTHLRQLHLFHCRLKFQASSIGLPNLIVLNLASVEAEGEEISRLISSCPQLEKLSLFGCLDPTFISCGGLPNLIFLHLELVAAGGEEISRLVSSCPQLEKFVLVMSHEDFYHEKLHISAPRLNTLCVKGWFKSLSVRNAQNLLVLDVYLLHFDLDSWSTNLSGAMATFFKGMEKLEQVSLNSSFCELLALSGAPQTNLGLGQLKRLELCVMGFDNPDLFRFVVSMICSSSNLKELDLSLSEDGYLQEHKSSFDYNFGHLVRVNWKNFTGTNSQMKIVGLLLKGSPILEEMSLQIPARTRKEVNIGRIQEEIKGYGLASSRVKIYYNARDKGYGLASSRVKIYYNARFTLMQDLL